MFKPLRGSCCKDPRTDILNGRPLSSVHLVGPYGAWNQGPVRAVLWELSLRRLSCLTVCVQKQPMLFFEEYLVLQHFD